MDGFEKVLGNAVKDIKQYDGMLSRTDLYEAVNTAVADWGIRDQDLAVQIGKEFAKYKLSLDIDESNFEPLQEFLRAYEIDADMLVGLGDSLKIITSSYQTDSATL